MISLVSNTGGVEVYIVGSIAGGTGSGMFLDVAFLTRNRDDFLNITGVLALPRVFMGKPFTDLVQSNAYGALKEIEYFWNPDPFVINYGNKSIEVTRSPFDLLFLVDSLNEMGRVVGDPSDLQSLIADSLYVQIGSQIGVDSNNAADNIKAMLSERMVNKRRVSYCSFGVAYLSLPVQKYEKMQLEDTQRLISNDLLGPTAVSEEIEQEVEQFISTHKLEINSLLEALSEKKSGGQMRFGLTLAGIKFNQRAEQIIKDLHSRCYSTMEQQVSQQLEATFIQLETKIIDIINQWREKAIAEINGLDYTTKFVGQLKDKLGEIQLKIQDKYAHSKKQLSNIKFNERIAKIGEATKALNPFTKERKIEAACQNYAGLVKQQCQMYIHMKRCDKAGELLIAINTYVDEIIQQQVRIRSSLDKSLAEIERQLKTVDTKTKSDNPFEHTIARFDVEANRPKISHDDLIRWLREENKSIINWSEIKTKDVEAEIKEFMDDSYRSLTEMSIDEVLRNSDPDEVNQDLTQLWNLAFPLWRYDEGKIPTTDSEIINESCYYGTEDSSRTVLRDPVLSGKLPQGITNPSFISTAESHRITLFRVKVGVPLFALYGIEDMEQAYRNPSKAFKHLHKDWVSFKNLIPPEDDQGSLCWFALALALKIIQKKGKYYCIDSQLSEENQHQEIRLGKGRIEAFKEFRHKKNRKLVQETEEKVEQKLDFIRRSKSDEEIMTFLSGYQRKLGKQLAENQRISQEVREQVEVEMEAIEEYMREIDPDSLN